MVSPFFLSGFFSFCFNGWICLHTVYRGIYPLFFGRGMTARKLAISGLSSRWHNLKFTSGWKQNIYLPNWKFCLTPNRLENTTLAVYFPFVRKTLVYFRGFGTALHRLWGVCVLVRLTIKFDQWCVDGSWFERESSVSFANPKTNTQDCARWYIQSCGWNICLNRSWKLWACEWYRCPVFAKLDTTWTQRSFVFGLFRWPIAGSWYERHTRPDSSLRCLGIKFGFHLALAWTFGYLRFELFALWHTILIVTTR